MASIRRAGSAKNTYQLHPTRTIIVCVALQHGLEIDDVTTERCLLAVQYTSSSERSETVQVRATAGD